MSDGKYNATPQTAVDGGTMELQLDANGNLKTVSGATGASANQVQGNVAAAGTDAGNPVKVGGVYNSSLPTYTTGKRGDAQITAKGAQIVSLYTVAGVEIPFPAALAANGGIKIEGVAGGVAVPMSAAQLPTTLGTKAPNASMSIIAAGLEYETVAASQTAQAMGATGATGDYLSHVIIQPTTTAAGTTTILDNATVIYTFTTGTLADLRPITIPVNAFSVSGAWKITTGANVTATAFGDFT